MQSNLRQSNTSQFSSPPALLSLPKPRFEHTRTTSPTLRPVPLPSCPLQEAPLPQELHPHPAVRHLYSQGGSCVPEGCHPLSRRGHGPLQLLHCNSHGSGCWCGCGRGGWIRDADVPVGVAGADPAAPALLTTEREITSPPSSPFLPLNGAHPQRFPYSTLHSTFCIPVPFPIPYPNPDPISLQPAVSISHFLRALSLCAGRGYVRARAGPCASLEEHPGCLRGQIIPDLMGPLGRGEGFGEEIALELGGQQ